MGFFTKRLLRAFKLLTNTVNLHEMNRAYVCPKLVCAGTVFWGKHLAGPDATFRSIKLVSSQHPLCAPGLLGASVGKVPKAKAAEATQNSGITPEPSRLGQPPAEGHSEGPSPPAYISQEAVCICQLPSWTIQPVQLPPGHLSLWTSQRKFLTWVNNCCLQFWTPFCPFCEEIWH